MSRCCVGVNLAVSAPRISMQSEPSTESTQERRKLRFTLVEIERILPKTPWNDLESSQNTLRSQTECAEPKE